MAWVVFPIFGPPALSKAWLRWRSSATQVAPSARAQRQGRPEARSKPSPACLLSPCKCKNPNGEAGRPGRSLESRLFEFLFKIWKIHLNRRFSNWLLSHTRLPFGIPHLHPAFSFISQLSSEYGFSQDWPKLSLSSLS